MAFLQQVKEFYLTSVPKPDTGPQRALTNRFFDFWLLGGASLLTWFAMYFAAGHREHWAIDQQFKNLAFATATLSVLFNNPHFLISYKLAYVRNPKFMLTNWWQLIAVPILLVTFFIVAFYNFDVPALNVPGYSSLIASLASMGVNIQFLMGPRVGDLIFTLLFNFMYFTVGWHYTKQTFGCMMVYANFDKYVLTPLQRSLIRWNLLGIWWLNFTYGNLSGGSQEFSQFRYYSLDLPDVLLPITQWVLGMGFIAVLIQVFYVNFKKNKQMPSLNFLVPFVAMYIWWLPSTREVTFYMYLTPLFHSLQYLAFVYKVENTRLKQGSRYELKATVITISVILAAWLSFEFIPNTLDTSLNIFNQWHIFFFFTAAMLFINIHHYFIDNVLWRFKDSNIKNYLLA